MRARLLTAPLSSKLGMEEVTLAMRMFAESINSLSEYLFFIEKHCDQYDEFDAILFRGQREDWPYRPHLGQIGVHRGGYVGFNLKVPRLKTGNSIECRVAETGQSLIGSPRLVTEKDVGNK